VLKTIDGKTIDLGALYGKQAVYLKVWATWCVTCRQQMPHFERTFQQAGPDLAVIAIDSGLNDSLEDVRSAQRKSGISMPIVLDDGVAGAAFNLRVTPQHIVIGRDGRIQYVGHLADERLDAALAAARTGAPAGGQPIAGKQVSRTPQYDVGDRLPDPSATMLDGRIFHARQPDAKRGTVLVFISPWCEEYLATSRPAMSKGCREAREQMDAAIKRDTRYRWLGVASGLWATKGALTDYATQYKTAIPLTLDESGEWFRAFRVMHVPTVLLADEDGRIVRRIDATDANLVAELQSLTKDRRRAIHQGVPRRQQPGWCWSSNSSLRASVTNGFPRLSLGSLRTAGRSSPGRYGHRATSDF
jgi:thiol-disulfide isomerase/thioredoxin